MNDFEFRMDERAYAVPCIELIVVVKADLKGGAPLFLRLHDAYVEKFRSQITFIQLSSSKTASKIKPGDLQTLRSWVDDEAAQKQRFLGFDYQCGRVAKSIDVPQFEYMQDQYQKPSPIGAIRISLPVSQLSETLSVAKSFVGTLSGPEFMWGSIGYSFSWRSGAYEARDVREWMMPKLKRHPGFSTGVLVQYQTWSAGGVPHVGWVTLLGSELVERLGASKALESAAAKAKVTYSPLPGDGAMLQAGPEPSPGDVNRGDGLPLQRAVGRLIDPVRISDKQVVKMVFVEGFKLDDARAWVTRFFRDTAKK
jgi:hypothetical protein